MSFSSYTFPIVGVAATGLILYAAYFDHRRRTDPSFRKQIKERNQAWKNEKIAKQKAAEEAKKIQIRRRAREILQESRPVSPDQIEEYFMQNVSAAETLAKAGNKAEAAARFFRAYLVYRNKKTLREIYASSIAPDVLSLINTMILESENVMISTD